MKLFVSFSFESLLDVVVASEIRPIDELSDRVELNDDTDSGNETVSIESKSK